MDTKQGVATERSSGQSRVLDDTLERYSREKEADEPKTRTQNIRNIS